jgi:hypothetical protein
MHVFAKCNVCMYVCTSIHILTTCMHIHKLAHMYFCILVLAFQQSTLRLPCTHQKEIDTEHQHTYLDSLCIRSCMFTSIHIHTTCIYTCMHIHKLTHVTVFLHFCLGLGLSRIYSPSPMHALQHPHIHMIFCASGPPKPRHTHKHTHIHTH